MTDSGARPTRGSFGGEANKVITEVGSKICGVTMTVSDMPTPDFVRPPHYWTRYGFVFAGATAPATTTAITAASLLQSLARPGGQGNPPRFEEIAEFVSRLARKFMAERRPFDADGLFSAGFFGWCPFEKIFKIAYIDGRDDGVFRVDLSYPEQPASKAEPWLVLGSAKASFWKAYRDQNVALGQTRWRPRRVIEHMVAQGNDPTVGGSTSVAAAVPNGLEFYATVEPNAPGGSDDRRVFNGLDLEHDVGALAQYVPAVGSL